MGVDNSTTSDIGDHLELFRSLRQIAGGCLFCGDIGDPVTEVTLLSERFYSSTATARVTTGCSSSRQSSLEINILQRFQLPLEQRIIRLSLDAYINSTHRV